MRLFLLFIILTLSCTVYSTPKPKLRVLDDLLESDTLFFPEHRVKNVRHYRISSYLLKENKNNNNVQHNAQHNVHNNNHYLRSNTNVNVTNSSISQSSPIFLTSIKPNIGIGGFKITVYGNNFNINDPYFINVCNNSISTNCVGNCNYIDFILPDNNQGKCSVYLSNSNSLNFTYTIASPEIKILLTLDLDLTNSTSLQNFRNNFKESLVLSLPSINNVNQIYICDTCIIESVSTVNRRLLGVKNIEIKYRLVSLVPVSPENIQLWKNSIVSESNNLASILINNLQNLLNTSIVIVNSTNSLNNNSETEEIVEINIAENTTKSFEIWKILTITFSLFFGMVFSILVYFYVKDKKCIWNSRQMNNKNTTVPKFKTVVYDEGTSNEIIVHELVV